jgi:hypothetical protein
MNDHIPPLPELAIDGMSRRLTDQETVDRALKTMYEHRPDLLKRMAERDKIGESGPYDEFSQEFRRFVREELNVRGLNVTTSIFREARRRARLMYGLPI